MWCQTPTLPSPLGRPGGGLKYQRPWRSLPLSARRVPSRSKPKCCANGSCSSSVVNERAPSRPRMRCSAGMSSASAVCGGSGVSETISSTSWFSGSQKTRLCGVAGDAGRRLLELEERDDGAGVALLVAEVGVVAERRLEVQRVLDEPQAHHATPEVDVGLDVSGDPREVM